MERDELVGRVISLLESLRIPETDEEIARWFSENAAAQQPADDAESILEQIEEDPVGMMQVALEVLTRVEDRDLPNAGAVLLTPLLAARPLELAPLFEENIDNSEAFRIAFSRASMTGVPLEIQKRINDAMLRAGADPRLIVEYDEIGPEP